MSLLTCFYTFMTALFSALISVPFLRKWAFEQRNLDLPDERKMHTTPMPRLGGIAIFLSFLFAVLVFVPVTPVIKGFLVGGLIVFATGLIDDLTDLSAKCKFAGEVAGCLATIVIGRIWLVDLGDLFGFGHIVMPAWVGIPFTVFAVVGVINAFNLIDGLDGLAGGTSVMALSALFLIGWVAGDQQTTLLVAALTGSLLGFLKYNFYPARIFMGDAGSLTIGHLLGFLAIYTTQQPNSTVSPMVPVLILGVPLLDTVWVMSRRILNRISPFSADRSHLHHKFLDLGFEHRFTVIIIYTMTLFWISIALIFRSAPEYWILVFFLGSSAFFYFSLRYVLRHPQQFIFMRRDSAGAISSSVAYQRIVNLVDQLVPALRWFLVGFLLLAIWSVISHIILSWKISLILLALGSYLWCYPFSEGRHFLMLVIYAVIGMASMEVWHANDVLFAGLSIKRCGDILLAIAGIIAIAKLCFRKQTELVLSMTDYLTLAICIFLAIVTHHATLGFELSGSLLRAMVAILAVRTLCSHSDQYYRWVTMMSFAFLVFVVVVKVVV